MNFFQPIEQRTASNIICLKSGETSRVTIRQLESILLRAGPLAFRDLSFVLGKPILGGNKALACCVAVNPGNKDVCYTLYLVACDRNGSFALSPKLGFQQAEGVERLLCYGMVDSDCEASIDHLLVKAVIHQLDAESSEPDPR